MVERRALMIAAAAVAAGTAQASPAGTAAWGFTIPALEGGDLPLSAWRGRVLLVVNTASFCGFTPQYAALQRLHDRFEGQGLTVLGVPSNDFNQESTEAGRVREFCDTMFGITFPLAAISHVRGEQATPLFRWLASQGGGAPRWNFHKYLVGRDGSRVQGFATRVEPDSPELLRAVEQALRA